MPKLRNKQGNVTPEQIRERLRLVRSYVEMTIVWHAMAFPRAAALNMEGLLVLACIFIGESDHRPTNVTGLSQHARLPRATIYRRLEELMEAGKVVRVGNNYYLAENAITRDKSRKLSKIVDILCGD